MGCQLCRNDLHDENEMSKDPNTNQLEPNNKKRTLKSGRHITPSKHQLKILSHFKLVFLLIQLHLYPLIYSQLVFQTE